jgi:hypothetical protein
MQKEQRRLLAQDLTVGAVLEDRRTGWLIDAPQRGDVEQIVRNIDCHVWSAGAGSNETLRAIIRWIGDDVVGRAFG